MGRKDRNSGHKVRGSRGPTGQLSTDEMEQIMARLRRRPTRSDYESPSGTASETIGFPTQAKQGHEGQGIGRLVVGQPFDGFLEEFSKTLPGFKRREVLYLPYYTVSASRKNRSVKSIVTHGIEAGKLEKSTALSEMSLTTVNGSVINRISNKVNAAYRVAMSHFDEPSGFYPGGFQANGERRALIDELDPRSALNNNYSHSDRPHVTLNLGRIAGVGVEYQVIDEAMSAVRHLLPSVVTLSPITEIPT